MRDAHEGACELREHARDGGARGSDVTGDASACLDTEDVLFLCHRSSVDRTYCNCNGAAARRPKVAA